MWIHHSFCSVFFSAAYITFTIIKKKSYLNCKNQNHCHQGQNSWFHNLWIARGRQAVCKHALPVLWFGSYLKKICYCPLYISCSVAVRFIIGVVSQKYYRGGHKHTMENQCGIWVILWAIHKIETRGKS